MEGRTPDGVFTELLSPGQRRLIESPEVLYALFWDRKRRLEKACSCREQLVGFDSATFL